MLSATVVSVKPVAPAAVVVSKPQFPLPVLRSIRNPVSLEELSVHASEIDVADCTVSARPEGAVGTKVGSVAAKSVRGFRASLAEARDAFQNEVSPTSGSAPTAAPGTPAAPAVSEPNAESH